MNGFSMFQWRQLKCLAMVYPISAKELLLPICGGLTLSPKIKQERVPRVTLNL